MAILDPSARVGKETILIAEDEPSVRSFLRVALGMSGFAILEAASGQEALRVVEGHAQPIHALVTDLTMPGMSGTQLAHRLSQTRDQLKVLYLSGLAEEDVFQDGVIPMNSAFLQKPFSVGELAGKVRELLDRRTEFQADPPSGRGL